MLVVRFKETFRERASEWIQSAGMLAWGLLALSSPNLFINREFYHPLLLLMPQIAWGIVTISVGLIRLIFLFINGAWRPSAHIRALGCGMGAMLWSALFVSAISLDWLSTAAAVYSMATVSDMLSLWFASGDAKLADLSAKKRV